MLKVTGRQQIAFTLPMIHLQKAREDSYLESALMDDEHYKSALAAALEASGIGMVDTTVFHENLLHAYICFTKKAGVTEINPDVKDFLVERGKQIQDDLDALDDNGKKRFPANFLALQKMRKQSVAA